MQNSFHNVNCIECSILRVNRCFSHLTAYDTYLYLLDYIQLLALHNTLFTLHRYSVLFRCLFTIRIASTLYLGICPDWLHLLFVQLFNVIYEVVLYSIVLKDQPTTSRCSVQPSLYMLQKIRFYHWIWSREISTKHNRLSITSIVSTIYKIFHVLPSIHMPYYSY